MRKRAVLVVAIVFGGALTVAALAAYGATSDDMSNVAAKRMISYLEVPSVSVLTASGSFEAAIRGSGTSAAIDYRLTYSGLSSTVSQAHIHFAQVGVNGGISAWLCEGTSASPSATTPTCPPASGGTVTGTITDDEVIGPVGQGIAATEIDELIAAMRAGFAYANVHTANFGNGEIRGQIARGGGGDDD
jgi:hypothetical protein